MKNTIEFTKEQFEALLKVVYLGNWMANANRTEDVLKEYEHSEDYIFSQALKFGLADFVDHAATDGKRYFPTRMFEEGTDVRKIINEYDDESFWDELSDRLGERDFYNAYTSSEIEKMNQEERFTKLYECIDAWNEELVRHGVERLKIVQ